MKKSTIITVAVAIFVSGIFLGNVISVGLVKDVSTIAGMYGCEAASIMTNNKLKEATDSLQNCNIILNKQKDNAELCIKGLEFAKDIATDYVDWANKQQLKCQNELKSCRAKN